MRRLMSIKRTPANSAKHRANKKGPKHANIFGGRSPSNPHRLTAGEVEEANACFGKVQLAGQAYILLKNNEPLLLRAAHVTPLPTHASAHVGSPDPTTTRQHAALIAQVKLRPKLIYR